jgi:ABC-type multidrug transport system fused ATPase/permease subunit
VSSNSSPKTVSDALLDVQQNSNRLLRIKRFGVVMVIITLLGSIVLPYTLSLAIASALFAASIVLYPPLLYPIYWLLMPPLSLGLKLLLGILFYAIVCPAAFFSRILGIDIIQRNIKPEVKSYWIERKTLLPHGKYMTSQR